MANTSDYVSRVRDLATEFIQASQQFDGLYSENKYLGHTERMTDDDLVGENSDLTAKAVQECINTLAVLLGGITEEQRSAIYQLKR